MGQKPLVGKCPNCKGHDVVYVGRNKKWCLKCDHKWSLSSD